MKLEGHTHSYVDMFAIILLQRSCYHPNHNKDICARIWDLSTYHFMHIGRWVYQFYPIMEINLLPMFVWCDNTLLVVNNWYRDIYICSQMGNPKDFGMVSDFTVVWVQWYNIACKWEWKSFSLVQLFGPYELYSPWNSPGQNTGVDSLSLLQGIFPTQGSNPGLPHCRQILYQLSHKGSPNFAWTYKKLIWRKNRLCKT